MLKYGDITRDESKLSQVSLNALLARGFAHFLGNEQASKVVAKIRAAVVAGSDRKAGDVSKEEIKSFREAQSEKVTQFELEAEAAALKSLDEGTIGVHVAAGPRRDPVVNAMRTLARAEVIATLKGAGLAVPKGEETVVLGGAPFTMDALLDRRLEKHGERLRKEAERHIAETERKARKLREEAAKAGSAGTAEDLGL